MDEAVLASYRKQIIRKCSPQRYREQTIFDHFVLSVAPALVLGFFVALMLFGVLVISASFKKVYAHNVEGFGPIADALGDRQISPELSGIRRAPCGSNTQTKSRTARAGDGKPRA